MQTSGLEVASIHLPVTLQIGNSTQAHLQLSKHISTHDQYKGQEYKITPLPSCCSLNHGWQRFFRRNHTGATKPHGSNLTLGWSSKKNPTKRHVDFLSTEGWVAKPTEALISLYTPKAERQGVATHQDQTCP
ncbi:hypothetical protein EVAR_69637_1 [Eumeta japonica]|uniref:Uncharacterized protein n=1 Tax=Eumeta variegata TaxID=151549 RepID=A0A4C1T2X7_EUMVA|nr:hypothetical protein EVAR_69637_1 [Eumeta japonica]